MRYFIEHSYIGTAYHGWQIQPNANTIQAEIEKALAVVLKQKVEIVGSSRTDTGVHARQQFAHFEFGELENLEKIAFHANALLPKDIAIDKIFRVNDSFHARFDATHRRYCYQIIQRKNPFIQNTAYFFRTELNIKAMNDACEIIKQYIDYQSFSKVNTNVKTFNCRITSAQWVQQDNQIVFEIQANRFLRGMVRAIVGTMLDIGTGKTSLTDFEAIIVSKNRNNAGRAVPAQGLTLVAVGYYFNT